MKNRPAFYVVLGLLGALAAAMLLPFVTPVLVAAVLGYLLLPVYDRLGRVVRSEDARAGLLVLAVLFLLALPVLLVVVQVADEVPSALRQTNVAGAVAKVNDWMDRTLGRHVPLAENFSAYAARVREAALRAAPGVIGAVGATALGLFIVLYTLFYVFTDGRKVWADFLALIPLDAEMKPHLVSTIQSTMTGVLYGQVVTAVVQGGLAGVAYLVFGIPHALFWTFLTVLAAMIPVAGTVVVWLPLAISRLVADDKFGGFGLLIYGGVIVMNVDNVIKPRLIAGRSQLHPLAAMFGVLGGMKLFGVVGFVLGPVLLGLLAAMLRFYREMAQHKAAAALLLAALLVAAPASAHDLWLVPERDGAKMLIRAQTGEHFPASEAAVTADRVVGFALVRPDGSRAYLEGSVEGKSFVARTEAVEGIVEISIRPRVLTLKPEQFEEYLKAEGLDRILALRKQRALEGKPNPERYSKYAKALLGGTTDRPLGHELEIVLLRRPKAAGEETEVRVLFRGLPLAGARVAAGTRGNEGHHYPVAAFTGLDGAARLRLEKSGLWFIRTLRMIPRENDAEAVWETCFATVTFRLPE